MMQIIFACRRNRLGDIGLIKLGIAQAGHRLRIVLWPWAFVQLLLAAVARALGRKSYLVISDKFPGDMLPARLFGRDCTRMLWNYADEWPASGVALPSHRVCFFREAGFDTDDFVFAPQPPVRPAGLLGAQRCRPIVFIGDVTNDFPIQRGSPWWRAQFTELKQTFGYSFYLRSEYEELLRRELQDPAQRRLARVLAKNLLRMWIIEHTRKQFGAQLCLIGSNWRRFGITSEPSIYSEPARLELYRSAVINLDCGSKSGDGVLYPRSSELITVGGGLLQVRCSDTDQVFGERANEFSFDTPETLTALITARLAEEPAQRVERELWLVERLRSRELLMQHTIGRMLQHRDGPC